MEMKAIRTRILTPPKDDIYSVFEESVHDVRDGDILLISSKILSIHQGRCIPKHCIEKKDLILKEADYSYSYTNKALGRNFLLTIKENTLVSASGVDESNGDHFYILYPERSTEACQEIWSYFRNKYTLQNFAVICVDSVSTPLRYGAVGSSIGFFGMHPLKSYIGKPDLFGRPFVVERSNMIDMIASSGVLVMGEGSEQVPIAIARGVSGVDFCDTDTRDELYPSFEEDKFLPLFQLFEKRRKKKKS